jgi:hypothetical protein
MPSGEMRRAPQLWEQRLARVTSILGVGISSSGDATAVVPPEAPPGSGGGTEPAPVLPPPGAFIKPSTPTLVGGLQGINVLWDGLNSASELWPYDTSWVEVHASTAGTAFTPGTATLKGRLARPGALFVGGLSAGTAYYFRLRGADPAGNYTEASDAATGYTGLTTASDYGTATIGSGAVSFNARQIGGVTNTVSSTAPSSPLLNDVWLDSSPGTAIIHKIWNGSTWVTNAWGSASIAAGQITALQIAAGAVTAGAISAGAVTTDKLTAGTISGFYISGGTIAGGYISGGTISGGYITGGTLNAGFVTGGTVQGALVQSSSGNNRIALTSGDSLDFYNSGSSQGSIKGRFDGLDLFFNNYYFANKANTGYAPITTATVNCSAIDDTGAASLSYSGANRAFRVAATGEVYSYGIDDNTTANAANVRVGASAQLLKSTSTQRVKTNMAPLADTLPGVDPAKMATDPASVDPYDVLDVVPTEFESLAPSDNSQRILGFIAENVAEAFPWAAEWDDEGLPSSVADRPILAALLAVVRDQHNTITDLRTRIEALEA